MACIRKRCKPNRGVVIAERREKPPLFLKSLAKGVKMRGIMKILTRVLGILVSVLLAMIVCTVFLQVIFRYVVHAPLNWSEEFAKLCFVWLIFLGVPLVTHSDIHIRVDYFVDLLPARLKKRVTLFIDVISVLFFVTVAIFGVDFIGAQAGMKSVALNIPMICFSWAVPVGMFLEAIFTLNSILTKRNQNACDSGFIE